MEKTLVSKQSQNPKIPMKGFFKMEFRKDFNRLCGCHTPEFDDMMQAWRNHKGGSRWVAMRHRVAEQVKHYT